jgi:hypothetical protein
LKILGHEKTEECTRRPPLQVFYGTDFSSIMVKIILAFL